MREGEEGVREEGKKGRKRVGVVRRGEWRGEEGCRVGREKGDVKEYPLPNLSDKGLTKP